MRALSYSEVRNNLANVLDKVIDDSEPTIVTRRGDNEGARAVIILSLETYNSMTETAHLLRGKNRERLMHSISQMQRGDVETHELLQAKDPA